MSTTQWLIGLVVTLIAGGAMGSVVALIAAARRNRIQPIGVQKEIIPFVNKQVAGSVPKAEILIKMQGEERSFSNLVLGRVTLENIGNRDYEEFQFGITLFGLDMAVYLHSDSQDRHHKISSNPEIDFNRLDNEIDFTLSPFNRGDVYSVTLFILPISEDDSVEMSLSSKHPVRFVELAQYRTLATSLLLDIMEGMPIFGIPVRSMRRLLDRE